MHDERPPAPIFPARLQWDTDESKALLTWPYRDDFVLQMLGTDIPKRINYGNCSLWIYRNAASEPVGFGTLDLCRDYDYLTEGRMHRYIPLVAVNPSVKSLGYGTAIVRHLCELATVLSFGWSDCHPTLILDVYTASEKAIQVYRKSGFEQIVPEVQFDTEAHGKPYIVMGKSLAIQPD